VHFNKAEVGFYPEVKIKSRIRIGDHLNDRVVYVPVNPIVFRQNQEIGPHNATHEVILFSHERCALEGPVVVQKEAFERGGSVNRPEVERNESPNHVCLPEGRRKNQTHQAPEKVLVPVQNGEIFYGFEEFRSFLKLLFKPLCNAAPMLETGGQISTPELDKGSQAEHATKWVIFQHCAHRLSSLRMEDSNTLNTLA
jgi:hypothetical protein